MELTVTYDEAGNSQVFIPVHFEFKDHLIEFETLRRCLAGVEQAYRGVDVALYGTPLNGEMVLLPLVPGSVTALVGRYVKGGVIFAAGAMGSPMMEGFVEAATGKPLDEWGAAIFQMSGNIADSVSEYSGELQETLKIKHQERLVAQAIQAELCRKMLEADTDEFEELISEVPEASKFFEDGRRTFYEACKANERLPSVQFGIGAATRNIPRAEFSKRAKRTHIDPIEPASVVAEGGWGTAIFDVTITSPNWERLDQQRGWKGKLSDGKYIYFEISDSNFWRLVLQGEIVSRVPDKMRAQFIFQRVGGRYKSAQALRIINFNGNPISEPLPADQVSHMISERNNVSKQSQNVLFPEN